MPESVARACRPRERPTERSCVVIDRKSGVSVGKPRIEFGKDRTLEAQRAMSGWMCRSKRVRVEEEPGSERPAVEAIACNRKSGVRKLNAGLVRAPRLERQLEKRALTAMLHEAHACDRLLSA